MLLKYTHSTLYWEYGRIEAHWSDLATGVLKIY